MLRQIHLRVACTLRARLAFLLLAALGSGCVMAAEAELPDVEIATKGIAIPAAPPEADGDEATLSVTFRQKPNRAGLTKDAFSDVRVLSVNVAASGGINDLGFLRVVGIKVTSPEDEAAGKAAVDITSYTRAPGIVGPSLEMPSAADITTLWRGKELIFTLKVTGVLPTVPWTADIALRLGATLVY